MGRVVARNVSHAVTANGRTLNQLLTVPASITGPYSVEANPTRTVNRYRTIQITYFSNFTQFLTNSIV